MEALQTALIHFITKNGGDIVWIFVLFFFGKALVRFVVRRMVKLVGDGDETHISQTEKRAQTLGHIVIKTGNIIIYVIIVIMLLSIFGFDIRPVLAGAGILGLAVGFGAQSLVKDFVSGLFILLENQYGIGDDVVIGKFEGRVIKITMRSTTLRDKEGKTYHISNGSVGNVVNMSQK